MNAKNVTVLLAVVCAVLVGGLIYQHIQSSALKESDAKTITSLSNNWAETSRQLDETKQVNVSINKDLNESRSTGTTLASTLASASNLLARTQADLAKSSADLDQTQTALKTTQEDLAKRDAHIIELTTQNAALDKQAGDLKSSIDGLELAISDTRKKLENAEGDRVVLQSELKRLMVEKAELERQFNDISVLRTQLSKLKEELSISRRLDWIRRGLYGDLKGGQKMMQLSRESAGGQPPPTPPGTNVDLNVEVRSDGTLKVIPPPDKSQPAPGK